jgi:hypothetical protein
MQPIQTRRDVKIRRDKTRLLLGIAVLENVYDESAATPGLKNPGRTDLGISLHRGRDAPCMLPVVPLSVFLATSHRES